MRIKTLSITHRYEPVHESHDTVHNVLITVSIKKMLFLPHNNITDPVISTKFEQIHPVEKSHI